jgi:hypothetical protein
MSTPNTDEAKPRPGLNGRRAPLDVDDLPSVTKHGRAWNYKAMRLGLIKYVTMGDKRVIPPEEADRIEREGIPSLRRADAPPPKPRARFSRKLAESKPAGDGADQREPSPSR